MATGNIFRTDLYRLHHITQNSFLAYPKTLILEILKDWFSQDSYFHYSRDSWGFPNTPNATGLEVEAGLDDDTSTRIFISEQYRHDMRYVPAILVKAGSFKYVPISMSKNEGWVQNKLTRVTDGYNSTFISTPEAFVLSGSFEGQIVIDLLCGDIQSRDALVELVAAAIEIVHHQTFQSAGVFIRPISISSPSESDDYNRKIYKQSISCDIRTEWRQQIPIDSVIDAINFCIDFGSTDAAGTFQVAPNLEVNATIDILDEIQNL